MDAMLRPRVVDPQTRRLLVSRIAGSSQEADLTVASNCGGLGRVRHFRLAGPAGWPDNPLPIHPAAKWLGMVEPDVLRAQVFQLAGCAWRCWYCYVPYALLAANPTKSEWKTADELFGLYWAEPDRPRVLDLSGGSPDLAPEWVAWTMDAIEERSLKNEIYLWSDDNLSSDRLLQPEQRTTLRRIETYGSGYGKACCLKGFDDVSFSFNTGADETGFAEQLRILSGYAATNLDLFLYVTLTSPPRDDAPERVRRFVDTLAAIRPDLPSRTVPLFIAEFSAMSCRVVADSAAARAFQWDLLAAWTATAGPPLGGRMM